MENASKALLMAAGVLIGLLVLTLAVYLFITFGANANEIRNEINSSQLTGFNANFNVYADRDDITIYDIISLANLAEENNKHYQNYSDFEENYKITIKLGPLELQNMSQSDKQDLIKDNNDVEVSTGKLTNTFHLKRTANSGIKYNSIGRVSELKFQRN